MSAFGDYAEIYDTLNSGKDYAAEAGFVAKLLKDVAPDARTLISFGCGTGQHDVLLAEAGFETLGIDFSEQMLAQARSRVSAGAASPVRARFKQGDLRSFDAGQSFDAVISLFHVMSYQTTDQDLTTSFATIHKHMKLGAAAVFDVWHGPAVEQVRPEVRVRRAENKNFKILRIAEPAYDETAHIVTVKFTFFVENKVTGAITSFEEKHPMRYLFPVEIRRLIDEAGLTLVETGEWLTRKPPSKETWGVYYLVKKTRP